MIITDANYLLPSSIAQLPPPPPPPTTHSHDVSQFTDYRLVYLRMLNTRNTYTMKSRLCNLYEVTNSYYADFMKRINFNLELIGRTVWILYIFLDSLQIYVLQLFCQNS